MGTRPDWTLFAFGGAIALGATVLGLVALAVPPRPQDILLGPRLFPLLVMGGLVALGVGLMLSAWRGADSGEAAARTEGAPPPIDDWRGFALVALALLAFALLVDAAGFVIAEGALFAVTASAFGSRRLHVDAAVGLAVAGAAFVVFTYGLGLNLPSGALWRYALGPGGGT